jgi:hypothetical protein
MLRKLGSLFLAKGAWVPANDPVNWVPDNGIPESALRFEGLRYEGQAGQAVQAGSGQA